MRKKFEKPIKPNDQIIIDRDELSRFVCNIRTPSSNGSEKIGTAIFIERNNEPYLLTAEHVISSINNQSYIIMSDNNGKPDQMLLNTLINGSKFVIHEIADLAKAKINVRDQNLKYLIKHCFPFELIEIKEILISKNLELTSIGFPLGLGIQGRYFSPLTSRTYVSSPKISFPRFDNNKQCDFIILEKPSIGGYSGGPVFDLGYVVTGKTTHYRNQIKLLGLVHGTISDKTGGKLAAITPCKYLNGWL